MTTFLFWNTNRKELLEPIADLARAHRIDVLILAECDIAVKLLLERLNRDSPAEFHFPPSLCEKIRIFTRFSRRFLKPAWESERMSIRRLVLPARTEILLAVAHFPSKLFWSDESQSFECTDFSTFIREQEARVGHVRTLLVGDLNMNPFEKGLVSANGFNAVMTRELALRRSRTVQKREYPFFYNPMWSHFGDGSPGPPGTYYYDRGEHVNYYWNIFDQILVRPDLLPHFKRDGLEILTAAGSRSLLGGKGRLNAGECSDHLPLLFRLDL